MAQNLTKLLGDLAPGCCKEQKVENYFGRKVAIDASMHIYQFLVGPDTALWLTMGVQHMSCRLCHC